MATEKILTPILQKNALEKILCELEEKFLAQEKIKSRFLNGRTSKNSSDANIVNRLDLIDAVHENAKTSLQFGNFRRAAKYLTMLNLLCEKFFKT